MYYRICSIVVLLLGMSKGTLGDSTQCSAYEPVVKNIHRVIVPLDIARSSGKACQLKVGDLVEVTKNEGGRVSFTLKKDQRATERQPEDCHPNEGFETDGAKFRQLTCKDTAEMSADFASGQSPVVTLVYDKAKGCFEPLQMFSDGSFKSFSGSYNLNSQCTTEVRHSLLVAQTFQREQHLFFRPFPSSTQLFHPLDHKWSFIETADSILKHYGAFNYGISDIVESKVDGKAPEDSSLICEDNEWQTRSRIQPEKSYKYIDATDSRFALGSYTTNRLHVADAGLFVSQYFLLLAKNSLRTLGNPLFVSERAFQEKADICTSFVLERKLSLRSSGNCLNEARIFVHGNALITDEFEGDVTATGASLIEERRTFSLTGPESEAFADILRIAPGVQITPSLRIKLAEGLSGPVALAVEVTEYDHESKKVGAGTTKIQLKGISESWLDFTPARPIYTKQLAHSILRFRVRVMNGNDKVQFRDPQLFISKS